MKENWLKDELYRRLSRKESSSDLDQLWEELETKRYPRKKSRGIWIWSIPILLFLGMSIYLILGPKVESMASDSVLKVESIALKTLIPAKEKRENLEYNESSKSIDFNTLNEDKEDLAIEFSSFNRNEVSQKKVQLSKSKKANISDVKKAKDRLLLDDLVEDIFEDEKHVDIETSLISTPEKKTSRIISLVEKLEITLKELKSPKQNLDWQPEMTAPVSMWNSNAIKHHMIGVSGSFGTMSSNLTGNSLGSTGLFTKEYYDHRNEIEINQDYLDLSLHYKYFFDNNFSIQTGISYQQYTSKYQMMTTDVSTEIVIDTIEIYMEGDDIVDAKLGEIPITTTKSSLTTNYIKYRMLRVPVLIGYEVQFSDKISMSLASGISIGLTMIGESRVSNIDPSTANFLNLEASGYTRPILFESVFEININRSFSNDWVATFGLKYNRDITNRLSQEIPANHTLSSFNFMIGLGKRF